MAYLRMREKCCDVSYFAQLAMDTSRNVGCERGLKLLINAQDERERRTSYRNILKLTQTSVSEAKQATVRSVDDRVNHIGESTRADLGLKKDATNDLFHVGP